MLTTMTARNLAGITGLQLLGIYAKSRADMKAAKTALTKLVATTGKFPDFDDPSKFLVKAKAKESSEES
jgi:hypothetical protein